MGATPRWSTADGPAAAAHALRQPFQQASIELCELGGDAVALGAATLPIARLLAAGDIRD